ncbi:MAG: TetR family transcriptional regulator [Candidatus Hydrogenedentales bacterium]|jgi:AcrR family transcriptional regulator
MARADRKNSILNAAEELFAVHGYEGTSTRAIAERAGANMALLAYYFGSKEGVFEAVVARRASALSERIRALAETDEAPWHRLNRFVEQVVKFLVAEHPDFGRILLRESTAPVGGRQSRSPLRASTRSLREVLIQIQAAGRAAGEFKYVDVDLSLNMLLGLALVSVAEASAQSPSESSTLSRRVTELATAAFAGLLARVEAIAAPLETTGSVLVDGPEFDASVDDEASGLPYAEAGFEIGEVD